MTELKSCPFCGSENVVIANHFGRHYGRCLNCYASSETSDSEREAAMKWNRRPEEPEIPKIKTARLSSLKDSAYVWILSGRCGIYRTVEKAKKEFPDWNVTAFLCEIDMPVINFDTFDQRIFDLVDDSECQFYIGDGEGDYPYFSPETVKQMYDILMAGIKEKGQFVKPTSIQVVKD